MEVQLIILGYNKVIKDSHPVDLSKYYTSADIKHKPKFPDGAELYRYLQV